MIELTKENFDEQVFEADGPVVVDFWGEQCNQCLEIMPDVERLAETYQGSVKFCKVDVPKNRRLAISHRVLGIPALLFFDKGEKVAELVQDDATPEAIETKIKEMLE